MSVEKGKNVISKLDKTAYIEVPKMETSSVMEIPQTNAVSISNRVESIAIDKRNVNKIRDLCKGFKETSFWNCDIFLALSTLAFGTSLSAIISDMPFQPNLKCVAFYTIVPMIGIGSLVAYYYKRKTESVAKEELAVRILEYLPEIKEEDNEH